MSPVEHPVDESNDSYNRIRQKFVGLLEGLSGAPSECLGCLFLNIGATLHSLGSLRLALEVWTRALEYSIQGENRKREGECRFYTGIALYALGHTRRAVIRLREALEVFQSICYEDGIRSCYKTLRTMHSSLGDLDEADEANDEPVKYI
ncbi:tetratricopeptide repeat protein [candidate division TA06 bacterium]|uniref:Tetratricopeptide repeat protein n=1 Tax=candidate division TA06 bacterium TaxID=2250710 RepID=A0A523UND0_UNCT6|nr:MAG: tetratricopeptide repeat protein [candidate division TA06 bacterium]